MAIRLLIVLALLFMATNVHAELGDPLPAIVPPGPDNPLGHFVLKLNMPGYLIHGTNQPYGVGMRVSHGCVRLYPENIEPLYDMVDIGEPVTIINEPYLAGWRDGELYFESHSPLEDDEITHEQRMQGIFDRSDEYSAAFAEQAEQDQANAVAGAARGVPSVRPCPRPRRPARGAACR